MTENLKVTRLSYVIKGKSDLLYPSHCQCTRLHKTAI